MNRRRGVAKTAVSDEPSVYLVVEFDQDKGAPRGSLKHRMNQRVCSGSSDDHMEAIRDVLAVGSSTSDDLTVRRSIV
jgi:hypothetical protein